MPNILSLRLFRLNGDVLEMPVSLSRATVCDLRRRRDEGQSDRQLAAVYGFSADEVASLMPKVTYWMELLGMPKETA